MNHAMYFDRTCFDFFMIFIYEIVFYIAFIFLSTLIRGNCFGFNTRKSKKLIDTLCTVEITASPIT